MKAQTPWTFSAAWILACTFLFLLLVASEAVHAQSKTCFAAVQDRIPWNYKGNTKWTPANVEILCRNAETTVEPARCFEQVMHGRLQWGGGDQWDWKQTLDLCKGTNNAQKTIACFSQQVSAGVKRQEASRLCNTQTQSAQVVTTTTQQALGTVRTEEDSPVEGCQDPDQDKDGADAQECGGHDCDDNDPDRAPGYTEICDPNGVDEDCDFTTVGDRDVDGDGFIDAACFNITESGERYGRDCNDQNPAIHPNAAEVCNFIDDNCDADVDKDVQVWAWPDRDGDGFGDSRSGHILTCFVGDAMRDKSTKNNDCNDADPSVNPAAGNC